MAEQGSPPRRPARQPDLGRRGYNREPDSEYAGRQQPGPRPDRHRRPERPERQPVWQQADPFAPDTEAEVPPWAGPSIYAARPGGTRLRPPRPAEEEYAEPDGGAGETPPAGDGPAPRLRRRPGRAAAARLRKSRRRVLRWCGMAIGACVVAAVVFVIATHHSAKPLPYVTTLLKGEFKSVPNACTAVSPGVLDQYLPATGRTKTEQFTGSGTSECTFTLDVKPQFLVLEIEAQAYQPFAAATGNGSASQNALDNFAASQAVLTTPTPKSPLPVAQITPLSGLGQKAFLAIQHEHVAGIHTDVVHVVVLLRNAVITITMQGQESGHGFGPVPDATLEAAGQAAARSVLAQVRTQPTA